MNQAGILIDGERAVEFDAIVSHAHPEWVD